ncbi:MAG: peptide transporter ATP-binding protein [Deltaproteobacteria bacterium]|jgi:oligopeptide/dipeptide ABC transporter ATP-binding protein|nr:peptide transporter ATP-binding protein [Deltaproteobacteria bacterium]MBP1716781.1 peptide transporter ATP-binding protein [Deltaproteobacteria bacterium]
MNVPLLRVHDLVTEFTMKKGTVRAVDKISFDVPSGETFGVVGESGSGKSVTALSILRLNPSPPARTTGEVLFQGENLLTKREGEMRQIRGGKISMIFQEPMTSLNPALTIERQIAETVILHQGLGKKEAREKAAELLELVSIPSARERLRSYPHEFSGGMRQRVMIAMALSCNPLLLIADEPTTALDVTIQAQFLELLADMIAKFKMSLIYITHDLFVIGQICKEVAVMYAGDIVEKTHTSDLFRHPLHPYTQGLMKCIPNPKEKKRFLDPIPGMVCNMLAPPPGCKFHPRCEAVLDVCRRVKPEWQEVEPGHGVSCHLFPRQGEQTHLAAPHRRSDLSKDS